MNARQILFEEALADSFYMLPKNKKIKDCVIVCLYRVHGPGNDQVLNPLFVSFLNKLLCKRTPIHFKKYP